MDRGSKLILVILILLVLTSSLAAVRYFLVNRSIYQRLLETEDLLSQETEEKESLSNKLQAAEQEMRLAKEKQDAAESELRRVSEDYKDLKVKYELAIREKEDLTSQVQKLTQEKLALENKVSGFEKDTFLAKLLKDKAQAELLAEKVSEELVTEKRKGDESVEKLNKIKSDKESLEEELQKLTQVKMSLETELSSLNERLETTSRDKAVLERQLRDRERKIQSSSDEIGRLKVALEEARTRPREVATFGTGAVELPPIIVKAEARADTKAAVPTPTSKIKPSTKSYIGGQIISVNEENNFVVINLGEEDGLKLGMDFEVYRGNERIGKLEVIEMRSRIAACDIKYIEEKQEIKVGDVVR
jgi:uncharacterized protein (DUF3084 family)